MSDYYGKGSIIYKILIVILTAALIASIYYPKSLWDKEERNKQECRYRMSNIYNAELQYQRFKWAYTDSLNQLIQFIKTDSAYHAYVDSIFSHPIDDLVAQFDSLKGEQVQLAQFVQTITPEDSVALDSLDKKIEDITTHNRILRDKMESVREFLKNHPCAPVSTFDKALAIIERKDFFLQYRIVQNDTRQGNIKKALEASKGIEANYDKIISNLRETKMELPTIYTLVDSLYVCPTVRKPYKLTVIDTSVIKYADVECPIDSTDIERVKHNFLLSTVGALKLENHGKIQGGEKSWETGAKR
ncbi:MAG: hypothetical protein D6814_08430 [Calditrichaeota bacterium]|nr:MAG: hypothetical protein D6814_08430 [Calditrichota bacterium]